MIAIEYCKSVFDGTHDTPKPDVNGTHRLLTSKNIIGGKLDVSASYTISDEDYNSINKRSKVHQWDILFSMIGTVGNVYLVTDETIDYAIKNMGVFSCRDEYKAKWLYYFLQSPYCKKLINVQMNGAVQKFLTLDWLRKLDIPEYTDEKKAIIDNLWNIDWKIALNDSICSDLESMAKLLYDYWFLQFDFPDENGNPYRSSGGKMVWNDELKREIPEGWEVVNLFDCADVLYGYPLRTEMFNAKQNGLPVVRIRDILNNSISAYTSESIPNKYLTECGDLLIGMDGNFQMNYWSNNGDCINQRIVRIREKNIPVMIIKMQIEPFINAKVHNVARSTVAHLSDKDLKSLKILIPDNKLDISLFKTFIKEIVNLKADSKICSSLRDFLLPLLMNGQVTVK